MSKSILPGYPGDAFFPRLILIFTFFWTVILFLQNTLKNNILIKSKESNNEVIEIYYKDIFFLFFISIIYILFLDLIGFEILTFIFLFVLLVNRLDTNIGKSILYSTIISFISMIVFWLTFIIFLRIPFPLKFLPFLIY
tara:strand:- start:104 stop:520 length:417 start_codon:yes stop_codon:yes gene_type:complete